jgi:hypothetical protein
MTDDEAEREIRNRLVEIAENNVGVDADQAEDRLARALRHALVAIADVSSAQRQRVAYLTGRRLHPACGYEIGGSEAYDALLATAKGHAQACPCFHTTPCHPDCTCVSPMSSHGCDRCCTYGSPEQQQAQAERLARLARERDALLAVINRHTGTWDQGAAALLRELRAAVAACEEGGAR